MVFIRIAHMLTQSTVQIAGPSSVNRSAMIQRWHPVQQQQHRSLYFQEAHER